MEGADLYPGKEVDHRQPLKLTIPKSILKSTLDLGRRDDNKHVNFDSLADSECISARDDLLMASTDGRQPDKLQVSEVLKRFLKGDWDLED